MRIAVLGAGAVGSYYGGRLAEAGHDVTLVGRRRHVAAIRAEGLTIESKVSGTSTSRPAVSETLQQDSDPELVLLTVKAFDTAGAARFINELNTPPKAVLSLQNGVDNHVAAAEVLDGVDVYPTVVYVAVEITAPGVVAHRARGEIVLPEEPGGLVSVFEAAGIPASTTDNIIGMLWNKLLLNASLNALSMITDTSFGQLASSPEGRGVVESAVEEVVAVAKSMGIDGDVSDPVVTVLKAAESLGAGMSSMWQDHQAGKKIETDALNGVVVRSGQEHGVPTPVNATLYAVASLMARRQPDAVRASL